MANVIIILVPYARPLCIINEIQLTVCSVGSTKATGLADGLLGSEIRNVASSRLGGVKNKQNSDPVIIIDTFRQDVGAK